MSIIVLLLLMLVRGPAFCTGVWARVGRRISRKWLPRWVLPLTLVVLGSAYGSLMWYIGTRLDSPVVIIGSVFGGATFVMGIATWLSSLFVPPLSQASFEQAMAEQTGAITKVMADATREGNAEMAAAISALTRQMSELSGDIRALLAARSGDDSPSDVQN